jgi:thiamine transport system ATP-binding protein
MLRLTDVRVQFDDTVAIDGIDLEVSDGERLSVLGPSGSGKSTLLRAICGLEPLISGRVEWDGDDLAAIPVHRRGFGLMFQDYVLFPHLDVARNVAFGPEMERLPPATVKERVADALAIVRMTGYERRLPAHLSGGEQQRVALARALAPRPRLLMLDEPLGALDRSLRRALLDELTDIFTGLSLPIIYVTHDHEEALAMGDRVAVMRAGRIETVQPPRDLWLRPPSEYVARFLGLSNVVEADVREGIATTAYGSFAVGGAVVDGRHRLLLRSEAFRPADDGGLELRIRSAVFRGDHTLLRVAPLEAPTDGHSDPPTLDVNADWTPLPGAGDVVRLSVDPVGVVVLPLT